MKPVAGYVVGAIVLAGVGGVCWLAGGAERRVAASQAELLTMRYEAASIPDDTDRLLAYARRLPGIGGALDADARDGRATAEYWLARYDALKKAPSGSGDADSQLLLLAANAGYRAVQDETVDRPTALGHLNEVIKNYSDVMKRNPEMADAAFNYEFAVRRRDELARQRGAAPLKIGVADLAPTIHGRPGGPPKGVSMSQFKVLVPKRSDERQSSPEAGQGNVKQRKG